MSADAISRARLSVDGAHVFIGSFNFDPRSAMLNTEIGLSVRSPELAKQLVAFMDAGVAPAEAYRLELDDGALVWGAEEDGKPVRYTSEPKAGWLRKVVNKLLSFLPIEGHL